MNLAFDLDLQGAIYRRLAGDGDLAALIGDAVYDAPPEPASAAKMAYVTFGEERVRPFDTKTSVGAAHEFSVIVHSGEDGFAGAKRVAAGVCAALVDAPLALAAGRLVSLRFLRATAERAGAPEKRRVTLVFRALIDLDA